MYSLNNGRTSRLRVRRTASLHALFLTTKHESLFARLPRCLGTRWGEHRNRRSSGRKRRQSLPRPRWTEINGRRSRKTPKSSVTRSDDRLEVCRYEKGGLSVLQGDSLFSQHARYLDNHSRVLLSPKRAPFSPHAPGTTKSAQLPPALSRRNWCSDTFGPEMEKDLDLNRSLKETTAGLLLPRRTVPKVVQSWNTFGEIRIPGSIPGKGASVRGWDQK